jgi:[ribosomal protein S18]-alanine N-acetyltransferase
LPEAPGVRAGGPADLERVSAIQAASPEAANWNPADYLEHDFRVVECSGAVEGFAVARPLAPGESELLNLAVAPEWRRRGLARALLQDLAGRHPGLLYLEVRESNESALRFYKSFGFEEVGRRPGYYRTPSEGAVVMKFLSC